MNDVHTETIESPYYGTFSNSTYVCTIIKVELKSISFIDAGAGNGGGNEHVLYENSSTAGGWGAGTAISDPVWVCDGADVDSDPDKNAPVCYTRTTTTVESKMNLQVVLRAQPSGLTFDLIGLDGTTEYFRKNGETSSGVDQTVTVVASQNLPSTVDKLVKTFTWKAIFTDPNPDVECPIQATVNDVYVVYSSPLTTLTRPEWGSEENKPTKKRLDFCIVAANTQGRGAVHGTAETSIAQALQSHIAKNIFGLLGYYQQYPTPSPIWSYIKTKEDGGIPKADCIQQSCMLAAGLGQLGIAAGGDHAYPSSDNDCSFQEAHPTVPGRVLRYLLIQNSDDTGTIGVAYLNNFQATAWVEDESAVKKYYTMWPLYPPKDTLLAVLQYERSCTDGDGYAGSKYLQYWSFDGAPALDPNRFVDETLHSKRVPTDWPPVWNNAVPLP